MKHGASGRTAEDELRTGEARSPPTGPCPMPDVRGLRPLTLAQDALDHLRLFFLLFLLFEAPDAPFFERPRFGEGGLSDLRRFLFGLPCLREAVVRGVLTILSKPCW